MHRFKQFLKEINQKVLDQTKERLIKPLTLSSEIEQVEDLLKRFNALSMANKIKGIDIQKITIPQLIDIVNKYENVVSKTQGKKIEKSEGVQKVFENDLCTVFWIKDVKASCYYGANTKWCISGKKENMFNEYEEDYNIFFLIPKNEEQERQKRKHSSNLIPSGKIAFLIDAEGKIIMYNEQDVKISREAFTILDYYHIPVPLDKNIFPNKKEVFLLARVKNVPMGDIKKDADGVEITFGYRHESYVNKVIRVKKTIDDNVYYLQASGKIFFHKDWLTFINEDNL